MIIKKINGVDEKFLSIPFFKNRKSFKKSKRNRRILEEEQDLIRGY